MLHRASSRLSLRRKSTSSSASTATPPVPSVPQPYSSTTTNSSRTSQIPRQNKPGRVLDAPIYHYHKTMTPSIDDLYDQLATTAKGFIESTNAATPRDNNPDYDLIRSYAAPHFRIEWAPKLFARSSPVLREAKDIDGFLSHIKTMSANLSTWAILIQDLFVDTRRRSVVARADFWMLPNGGEKVCNDIVFFMKMDQSGEKIVDCTEYVDPEASKVIRDRIAASRWEGGGGVGSGKVPPAVNGARGDEGDRIEVARK